MKKYLKGFFGRYELEILLVVGLWLAWKLRGLFSAAGNLSDTVSTVVAGATANIQENSKLASQRAGIRIIYPDAKDSDILQFDADAKALAGHLGKLKGSWSNYFTANRSGALGVAKKYSHYIQVNNIVQYHTVGGKRVPAERLLKYRLPVLFTFYAEATGGGSLMADLDAAMNLWNDDIKKLYNLYVK